MTTTRPPRYYIPLDGKIPAHLPKNIGRFNLQDDAGPCDAGGMILGGIYVPNEPGWIDTGEGWWFNMHDTRPQDCCALHMIAGPMVPIANTNYRLEIPQLLRVDENKNMVSALDRVLTREGWETPAAFRAISHELKMLLTNIEQIYATDEGRLVSMCVELIRINYPYLSVVELMASEWLTESKIPTILSAAGGIMEAPDDATD